MPAAAPGPPSAPGRKDLQVWSLPLGFPPEGAHPEQALGPGDPPGLQVGGSPVSRPVSPEAAPWPGGVGARGAPLCGHLSFPREALPSSRGGPGQHPDIHTKRLRFTRTERLSWCLWNFLFFLEVIPEEEDSNTGCARAEAATWPGGAAVRLPVRREPCLHP